MLLLIVTVGLVGCLSNPSQGGWSSGYGGYGGYNSYGNGQNVIGNIITETTRSYMQQKQIEAQRQQYEQQRIQNQPYYNQQNNSQYGNPQYNNPQYDNQSNYPNYGQRNQPYDQQQNDQYRILQNQRNTPPGLYNNQNRRAPLPGSTCGYVEKGYTVDQFGERHPNLVWKCPHR